jgi:hypothetical protein
MPHRVTDFLRSSSGNLVHIKPKSNPSSRRGSLTPNTSDSEDGGDHHHHNHGGAIKSPADLADAVLKRHSRLSFPFMKKDHAANSEKSSNAAASLDWKLESPPVLFHGNTEDSTGAMVSGQLIMVVKEDIVEVESFAANLKIHVTHKRPFQNHCHECQNQYTELKNWQLLAPGTTLTKGTHLFPFSTLLDGHLPASVSSTLMTVEYEFRADAKLAPTVTVPHPSAIKLTRTLPVKRSLPEPELPHHSVRLFPPTNIKTSAHYSSVIHPSGTNNVSLKLDGLMSLNERTKTLDMWKVKRVSWKLEEVTKTTAPACEKHKFMVAPPPPTEGEQQQQQDETAKKGVTRVESRILGEKHLHEGWKSDFSGADGTVDFEFEYRINPRRHKPNAPKFACDLHSADLGIDITHSLLIELVVSKEYAPVGKPHMSAQTGTGRILRMHYGLVLTEHPGLGVSWDEESPPMYQDVPASPPGYPMMEEPIDYEELELLDAGASSPERRMSSSSTDSD